MPHYLRNMHDNLVFLDANILLEIILGRKKETQSRQFIKANAGSLAISALTAHLVVHFGIKVVDLPVIRKFLADYFVLEMTYMDFDWAFNNARNNDFEDALQLAIAIRNGCHQFVTLESSLYNTYKDLPTIGLKLLK